MDTERIILETHTMVTTLVERMATHGEEIKGLKETVYGDDSDGKVGHKIKLDRIESDVKKGKYIVGAMSLPVLGGIGKTLWDLVTSKH